MTSVFHKDYFGLKNNPSVQKILANFEESPQFGAIYTEKIYNISK